MTVENIKEKLNGETFELNGKKYTIKIEKPRRIHPALKEFHEITVYAVDETEYLTSKETTWLLYTENEDGEKITTIEDLVNNFDERYKKRIKK